MLLPQQYVYVMQIPPHTNMIQLQCNTRVFIGLLVELHQVKIELHRSFPCTQFNMLNLLYVSNRSKWG